MVFHSLCRKLEEERNEMISGNGHVVNEKESLERTAVEVFQTDCHQGIKLLVAYGINF